MAISGPNIGTSAFNETGKRYMSEARAAVRLPAKPGALSQMIGRSVEVNLSIASNHNYDKNVLVNWMLAQGTTPVVITITGDLVGVNTSQACLEFPSNLSNEYVQLNINSGVTVYGRGGNGGNKSNGGAGGTAINNGIGTRLRITNNGAIAGGGGGGGATYVKSSLSDGVYGGGGGRPFGTRGASSGPMSSNSTDATLTAAGKGAVSKGTAGAGNGGNVGAAGSNGYGGGTMYNGGAAGKAVAGSAPTWTKVGTIYGSRV